MSVSPSATSTLVRRGRADGRLAAHRHTEHADPPCSLRVPQRLDGHSIGEPHLPRAILDVPDSTVIQVLEFFAVDIEAFAHTADELALASPDDDGEFVTRTGRAEASGPISSQRTSRRLSRRTDYLFGLQSHDRLVARIECRRRAQINPFA